MSKTHSIQRQLHMLAQQNQALRLKAHKINEIQSYVNILIQSSQSSQEELNRSHQENRSLKIHVDQLMADLLKLEQHNQHEMGFMEAEFKRQMLRKDDEIRAIAAARDKESQLYEQRLSQSQVRAKNELQRMKLEFFSLQKQSQDQIHQLTSLLNEKCHSLQLSQDSQNQLKKAYLEESNSISSEIAKLQRAYHESQDQVFSLKEELARLTQLIQQLTASDNLLKKELARKEDEMLADRKSCEKKIRLLEESINELTAREKKALQKLNQTSLHNQKILKSLTELAEQNTDLKNHSSKLERLINQKDQEIKHLTLKIHQEEDEHKRHLKRHNEQLQRAEEELNLASERFLCEKKNSDGMKGEIEDLLKVIDKLQANLAQSEHNLQMVNKQNSVLFKQVENITKELKYRIEELNDIDQKYKQSRQNYLAMEEMYANQSLKCQSLDNENSEIIARLESITREQKSLQEQQIANMIEKHLSEKRDLLETNRLQKEAMSKKFEYALREKDEQLKKRLELLEDEISLMRVRH